MIKTTTKKAKNRIMEHINDFLEIQGYENIEDLKADVLNFRYKNIYNSNYKNFYEFINDGNFFIYYEDARAWLKEILEETDEEANKYKDDEVWHLYCHLLARELSK